jgi:hypothetical protein
MKEQKPARVIVVVRGGVVQAVMGRVEMTYDVNVLDYDNLEAAIVDARHHHDVDAREEAQSLFRLRREIRRQRLHCVWGETRP